MVPGLIVHAGLTVTTGEPAPGHTAIAVRWDGPDPEGEPEPTHAVVCLFYRAQVSAADDERITTTVLLRGSTCCR